jgi:hypothetical protein
MFIRGPKDDEAITKTRKIPHYVEVIFSFSLELSALCPLLNLYRPNPLERHIKQIRLNLQAEQRLKVLVAKGSA